MKCIVCRILLGTLFCINMTIMNMTINVYKVSIFNLLRRSNFGWVRNVVNYLL